MEKMIDAEVSTADDNLERNDRPPPLPSTSPPCQPAAPPPPIAAAAVDDRSRSAASELQLNAPPILDIAGGPNPGRAVNEGVHEGSNNRENQPDDRADKRPSRNVNEAADNEKQGSEDDEDDEEDEEDEEDEDEEEDDEEDPTVVIAAPKTNPERYAGAVETAAGETKFYKAPPSVLDMVTSFHHLQEADERVKPLRDLDPEIHRKIVYQFSIEMEQMLVILALKYIKEGYDMTSIKPYDLIAREYEGFLHIGNTGYLRKHLRALCEPSASLKLEALLGANIARNEIEVMAARQVAKTIQASILPREMISALGLGTFVRGKVKFRDINGKRRTGRLTPAEIYQRFASVESGSGSRTKTRNTATRSISPAAIPLPRVDGTTNLDRSRRFQSSRTQREEPLLPLDSQQENEAISRTCETCPGRSKSASGKSSLNRGPGFGFMPYPRPRSSPVNSFAAAANPDLQRARTPTNFSPR